MTSHGVSTAPSALRRLRTDAPPGFTDAVLTRLGLGPGERFVVVQGPAGALFVVFGAAGISAVVPAALVGGEGPDRFARYHRRHTGRAASPALRPPPGRSFTNVKGFKYGG